MQWPHSKNNAPFSKIPFILLSLMMTAGSSSLLNASQEIPSVLEVKSEEEAFLLRRIAEFWKDRDYLLVKRQIHQFLEKFPTSPINSQLQAILGDLLVQEKKYHEALKAYSGIKDQLIIEKTIINRLQCYYELNAYSALLEEGKPFLTLPSKKLGERKDELYFLIAEALFRLAVETGDSSVKEDFASQAKGLYEPLLTGSFGKHAKIALAEIYYIVKQYEKSANFYLELAGLSSDQNEELLNQAALAQAEYNAQAAIATFSQVASLKGKKAHDALINRLILLFQEEQYDEVIKSFHDVMPYAEGEKKLTLEYIVGRSYFSKEDFSKASSHLEKYIALQKIPSTQLKNALLMQLNAAKKTNRDELCESALAIFKQHFIDHKEYGQALFIHAVMARGKGDLITAEQELCDLLTLGTYDDKEALLLEYAQVTHENEKWEESYKTFKSFLGAYPSSSHRSSAVKYYLSCALNRFQTMDTDSNYSKNIFYEDMTFVLNEQSITKSILTEEEEKDCRLLNAKTAYEMKHYAVAALQLDSFIRDYPTDKNLGEAHFLAGICHQNLDSDPELFYRHIEKAIALNPDISKQSPLHLQLYNAYLSKLDKIAASTAPHAVDQQEKTHLYDQAAEHLFDALTLGDHQVKFENKLWLANHYYQKVKASPAEVSRTAGKRAIDLFAAVLTVPGQGLITLSADNAALEAEILKYSDILAIKGDFKTRIALLSSLAKQQNKNSDVNWSYPMQTLLELAQSYEWLKDYDNALETYEFIISINRSVPSYAVDYSTLHASRLNFIRLDADQKSDQNEQVLVYLNQLKDIQIRKSPASEPLHLESALSYAQMRADIAPKEEKDEKYLFFLGRMKEDYTSFDDPSVRDYHAKLAASPAKKNLYESYMSFLDGEILRVKAKIELKNNQPKKAEELNAKALSLFSSIPLIPGVTTYLSESIHTSKQSIEHPRR